MDTPTDPIHQPLRGSPEPVPGKCGAKLRRSQTRYGQDRFCTNDPMVGKTRCRMHGGKSLTGIASPAFEGKGYSKYLPTDLREDYDVLRASPNLLSLQDEVALLKARLRQVETDYTAEHHAGAALLKAARDAVKAWRKVEAHKHRPPLLATALTECAQAIEDLNGALAPAARVADLRAEEREMAKTIARVTKTETEDMERLHGMIALDVVLADRHLLVHLLKDALQKHLQDGDTAKAILRTVADGFAATAGRRDRPALTA